MCSGLKSQHSQQQAIVTNNVEPPAAAAEKNDLDDDRNVHKVPKKSVGRCRELERLGVTARDAPVTNSRQVSTAKKSDNQKSKMPVDSVARTSEDDRLSGSATDVDESSASESDTDIDSLSDEDITENEETASDSGSEVIIVSEVKGQNSNHNSSAKRSASVQGSVSSKASSGSSASGSIPFKKPLTQSGSQSRSLALNDSRQQSWWMQKVNVLETAMTEMKAKFAEVLRQKVIEINCALSCNERSSFTGIVQ